jgi:hypothetical protein
MTARYSLIALRVASYAGVFCTLVTIGGAIAGMVSGPRVVEGLPLSPLMLVDAALFAGLTVGLFFKSRICCTAMAAFYLVEKLSQWSHHVSPLAFALGFIFLLIFIQAAVASFYYHRARGRIAGTPPPLPESSIEG